MKKLFLALLALGYVLSANSQDRKFNFYPNVAIDLGGAIPFPLSDIPDGAGGTPKPYPSIGIGSEYMLNEKWQLGFEINYHLIAFSSEADVVSQPYTEGNTTLYYTGYTEADVELRMVEFPLIAFYKLKEGRRFLFGMYYSRILEGRFDTKGINGIYSPDKDITDNATLPGPEHITEYSFNQYIDKYDVGVLIGYRYNINHRFYLWGRLNVGFKSIFEKNFNNIDYEMYQVRINLGVSYLLFD